MSEGVPYLDRPAQQPLDMTTGVKSIILLLPSTSIELLGATTMSSLFPRISIILILTLPLFGICWRTFPGRIRIRGIHLKLYPLTITLSSPSYTRRDAALSLSLSSFYITFHVPRRDNPRWATVSLHQCSLKDKKHYVTIHRIHVTLWLFPSLSGYPPARRTIAFVELHDFRIQVYSSKNTPRWVEQLRRDLLYTMLNEDTRRLDNADLKLELRTARSASFRFDGDSNSDVDGEAPRSTGHIAEPSSSGELNDEAKVTFFADHWHTYNHINSRLYEFGRIDAQLRRSWAGEEGTFVLVSQECRWTRVLNEEELSDRRHSLESPSPLRRLASWLCPPFRLLQTIFSTIIYLCMSPMSLVDLYAPRIDVTFDHFRIRDAELYRHGSLFLQRYIDQRQLWSADIWSRILLSGIGRLLGV
uniref:Uncharacterized protein n=1 Tax=Moniliophthora roreri TaxID=221103 RepID=A0A0W0G8B0_MONRR